MARLLQESGPRAVGLRTTIVEIDARSPHSPSSPTALHSGFEPRVRKSLQDAWMEAARSFKRETSRELFDNSSNSVDGFLDTWAARSEHDDGEDAKKKRKIRNAVDNCLAGLNVVGSIVAQGASMPFPAVGPCFSAISFLLDVPHQISNVYSNLLDLFSEVEEFLMRFKILNRIDKRQMLDVELVESASKMLLSFVDVCVLASKLLGKHKYKMLIEASLLRKDPGMGSALTAFRGLAKNLDSLTSTLAFEHIRITEEAVINMKGVVEESNSVVKRTDARVGRIEASFKEAKTRNIDMDRLASIKKAIFTPAERSMWDEIRQSAKPDIDILPNTFDLLEKQPAYQKWYASAADRAILALLGEAETGKSYVIESLKQKLETTAHAAQEQDSKIYMASHNLRPRRIKAAETKKKLGSFAPFALRSMAVQIAEQNSSYAQELEQRLNQDKQIKVMNDLGPLWRGLGLSTATATSAATLYLFFESLEHENESSIEDLLNTLFEERRTRTNGTLKIRIIITGDAKVGARLIPSVSKIGMEALQNSLICDYVTREMKSLGLFQDSDPKSNEWREKVFTKIRNSEKRSFHDIKQKLERIQVAVREDLASEVNKILDDEESQSHNKQARDLLNKAASDLRPAYIAQINQIITWLLYSQPGWILDIAEIEAVLHLEGNYESLTSLAHKIENDFTEIFERIENYIDLRDGLEDALRESDNVFLNHQEQKGGLVSMEISIKDVEASAVRAFISQLNAQISSPAFDFKTTPEDQNNKIYANQLLGQSEIIRTCLRLLNGGWSVHTKPLLYYACEYLPLHLASLAQIVDLKNGLEHTAISYTQEIDGISVDEARSIGQGLVSFLSNPFHLLQDNDADFGRGEYWLAESESVSAIRLWLHNTRHLLQPHEQRWIESVIGDSAMDNLKFMEDFIRAISRKWVTRSAGLTYQTHNLFLWIDKYIDYASKNPQAVESMPIGVSHEVASERYTADHDNPDNDIAHETRSNYDATQDTTLQGIDNTGSEKDNTSRSDDDVDNEPLDSVQRAIRWLEQMKVEFSKDATFHICIGYTYLEQEKAEQAIRYFDAALTNPLHRRQALIGLGRAKMDIGETVSASQILLEAIAMHEEEQKEKFYDDVKRVAYADLLIETAELLEELGDYPMAITIYEKTRAYNDDLTFALRTLQLLCKGDREAYAMQLLTDWAQEQDGRNLNDRLYSLIALDPAARVFQMFILSIRGQPLRDLVLSILQSATEAIDQHNANRAKPVLLYLQGMLMTTGSNEKGWQMAADLWEIVLELIILSGKHGDYGYDAIFYDAARSLAGYRFTCERTKFLSQATGSVLVADDLARKLHDFIIGPVLDIPVTRWNRLDHPDCYAHSMSMILGQKDHGRSHALKTLETALEILTDEIAENDIYGYKLLLRFMCFMGDKVGALTAVSLFDRTTRRAKKGAASGAKLDSGRGDVYYEDTMRRICNGCRKSFGWFETDGSVWCQFCPDFDFCTTCYTDFMSGKLRLHMCSPTHEFVHLYHTEYSEEEIASDKVRIDWEWIDLGNGQFARRGGRIVDLKVWAAELRKAWILSDLTGASDQST